MATLSYRARAGRCGSEGPGPSIREICLLGRVEPTTGWAAGAVVDWEGRSYRVAGAQGAGPERYVHLAPEAGLAIG